ncbi:MAG TPA: chemotaxis protein CheD [Candidatus Edwardsbacteria bacterium]|nr:chemotaxis protein CheD [Candidatus Edwardsbacteria bacterium]
MSNELVVKIADLRVAAEPNIITTHGLGSCLAIVLYDPAVKAGGLAHVMLPSPELAKDQNVLAKFPRTAIPVMLKEMAALGCARPRITAKIAGGANMFGTLLKSRNQGTNIGSRNVAETKLVLQELGIPLVKEDTGGDYGRSVEFILSSGTVLVHSFKAGLREL